MIRRSHNFVSVTFGVCVLAAAGTGCRRERAPKIDATASRPAPEVSFEAIAKIVTDGLEIRGSGAANSHGSEDIGARGRFAVYNTVASKLIPPATPTDPYRGTITVTSQSVYSLRRAAEDEDEKKDKENAAAEANRFSLMDDADEDSGFEVMDNDLVSAPEGSQADEEKTQSVIHKADKDVRTYDLVYKDGRWVLETTLDPATEQSIKNAFDRALRLQL